MDANFYHIKLIEESFNSILNIKSIKILSLKEEEDIDYAIYLNPENHTYIDTLENHISDYAITSLDENKHQWIYMIAIHDNGNFFEPPSSDYLESIEIFNSFEEALENLILSIIKDQFSNISIDLLSKFN